MVCCAQESCINIFQDKCFNVVLNVCVGLFLGLYNDVINCIVVYH